MNSVQESSQTATSGTVNIIVCRIPKLDMVFSKYQSCALGGLDSGEIEGKLSQGLRFHINFRFVLLTWDLFLRLTRYEKSCQLHST